MAPLNVIVIGAGLGGLTAAIAFRQQGHQVTLLEKSKFLHEFGAAINMGANVSGILQRLGFDLVENGAVQCEGLVRFAHDGTLQNKIDMQKFISHWKEKWYFANRVDVHNELKRLAMDPEGKGPVPRLLLGVKITQVDAGGKVSVEGGETFVGDVIIGADGNRSISRNVVNPDASLVPWGKQCFRWLTPRKLLLDDPDTKEMCENDGYFCAISSNDQRMVLYPCRDNTVMNLAAFLPDEKVHLEEGETNKDFLKRAFSSFGKGPRRLLDYADEAKVWPLMTMDVMPEWNKDRLVLIGDAAHPFLPFLGMGGAIAIEDAVSLAILLQDGTPANEVPERLALYQEIRHGRGTIVQYGSRVAGNDLDKTPEGALP
nr:fad-dependent monooxygenase ops4 [Quercus suber]